jgi:transcriptional regulator with PAS, ATPase and Fis domain
VVFLDEVAEMPAQMQAKLLRVLEQEEVIPVGDTFPVKVDVRILSATNRDLKQEVDKGTFREDLYYRLSAFPIRVPPLRDRREDIALLASRFVAGAAERHQKRIAGIEPAAIELLLKFDWPGNTCASCVTRSCAHWPWRMMAPRSGRIICRPACAANPIVRLVREWRR